MDKTELSIIVLTGSDQAVLSKIASHLQSTFRLRHIRFMDLVRKEVAKAWQFDVELFNSKVFQETKDLRYSVAACNYEPFTNDYIDTHPYEHSITVQRSPGDLVMMWFKYRLQADPNHWFYCLNRLIVDECAPVFSGEGTFQHNGFVFTEITCESEADFISELPQRVEASNVAFKIETIAVKQDEQEPVNGLHYDVAIAHDVKTDVFCYGIIHDVSEHVSNFMSAAKISGDASSQLWGPYHNGRALAHGLYSFQERHGAAYLGQIGEVYDIDRFDQITDQKLIDAITWAMNHCEATGKIAKKSHSDS